MEDLEQRIARVRDDREHGSRWLVRETISILYDLASESTATPDEQARRVWAAGQELTQARPAMAAITGAVRRILEAPGGRVGMVHEAARLRDEYDTAIARITGYARPLLTGTLMTHSLSGTVQEVLLACASQLERVIVLEGRPRYEGREVARALSQHGIAVTLISDAQAAIFLPQCRAVVVGADSVMANGDLLNKAGTALLAWACQGYGIPFYVLCESLKITPQTWTGDLAQLEEKEPQEVLAEPIPGVTVRNFYFDHTPASLVTKFITEHGILEPHDVGLVP
ncbi:MAG: translation initiation factor eIF-2B [Ktedonobacteraceae bacterium]